MKKNREKRQKRSMMDRRTREHTAGGKLAIRMPQLPLFKPKAGEAYNLDFVPFKAGKGNPHADKGEPYFERTYYTHPGVGPNRDTVICNAKTHNEECFVCEYRGKLGRKPDQSPEMKEMARMLYPKERQLFLVRDRGEMKKGLQLWEYSFHLFGKALDNKINSAKGEQKKVRQNFAEPDEGCTLEVTGVEKAVGEGGKCVDFADIQFQERKAPLKQELLDQAICLDDLIPKADYDKVKKLFLQSAPDESGEDIEDPEDEDEDDSEDEEKDDEDEEEEEEDAEEDDDSDDEEDDEEDEDSDEEDEPPCSKGDLVLFKFKGKKLKGKVVKINVADSIVQVRAKDREEPHNLNYDEIVKILKVTESDEGSDEPKKKKKK